MSDLVHLRHFLSVIEQRGFRRAARHIHVSPSSVTRSVKMLEDEYGVPLLVRRGKLVEPTAFGWQLADEARALVAGFDGIGHRLGQVADLSRGTLRVGISPAMADVFLPHVGVRLLREHRGVSMETRMGHASEMLAWLVGREIDVAVGDDRAFASHGGLELTPLFQAEVPLWVRADHPLAGRNDVGVGDMVDYPVISQLLPGQFLAWFEGVCRAAAAERPGCRVNHAQQCSSYAILLRLVLDSDAIALLPTVSVLTSPWAEHLRRLPIAQAVGASQQSAVLLRSPSPTPLARKFVALMQETAKTVVEQAQQARRMAPD